MITSWWWVEDGARGVPPLEIQATKMYDYQFRVVGRAPTTGWPWFVAFFKTDGTNYAEDERIALDLATIYSNQGDWHGN